MRYIMIALVLTMSLAGCARSTPQERVKEPTLTLAQQALEQKIAAQTAAPERRENLTPMPAGHDDNPADISTLLGTFESAGSILTLTEEEWDMKLSEKEFYILRKEGTDRPYTGTHLKNKRDGIYTCSGCGEPLFSSHTKFNSGTGWPSFYQPVEAGRVGEKRDTSLLMARTEVHCSRCEGHLGHVFTDGPDPTGLRYCINDSSLDFVPTSN